MTSASRVPASTGAGVATASARRRLRLAPVGAPATGAWAVPPRRPHASACGRAMRLQTVIAPHEPEVRQQLDGLSPRLREIARRYVARLRLEPFLGHRLERGLLATEEARAVYFDRDSRPD